jgi:hypothetical protein
MTQQTFDLIELAIPSRGDALDTSGIAAPEEIGKARKELVAVRGRVRPPRLEPAERKRLGPGQGAARRRLAAAIRRLLRARPDLAERLRSSQHLWEQLASTRLSVQQARQATQIIIASAGDQVLRLSAAITDCNDRIEGALDEIAADPATPREERMVLKVLFSNGGLIHAGVRDAEESRQKSLARRTKRAGRALGEVQAQSVAALRRARLGEGLPTEAEVLVTPPGRRPTQAAKKTTTKTTKTTKKGGA